MFKRLILTKRNFSASEFTTVALLNQSPAAPTNTGVTRNESLELPTDKHWHLPFPSYHEIHVASEYNVHPSPHNLPIITLCCLRTRPWPFIVSFSSTVNSSSPRSPSCQPLNVFNLRKPLFVPPSNYLQLLCYLFLLAGQTP